MSTARRPLRRRTKAAYARLFDNPRAMFPDVDVLLYPNGEPEIWLRDSTGRVFVVTAGRGRAGFSVRFKATGPTNKADVSGNAGPEWKPFHVVDVIDMSACQYDQTDSAQAFRRWYAGEINEQTARQLGAFETE